MIIEASVLYARLFFGKTAGRHGAACVTAPTGGAAYNISGHTWHSVLGSKPGKMHNINTILSQKEQQKLQSDFLGTKFFVLDEASLVTACNLFEIHVRLKAATQVS